MTEQKLMLQFQRNRTNMESHEPRTSKGQQMIRELRSEVMQMQASAVSPNPTRDLEAKIQSQKKYEIQSLPRDLQKTQDSLKSWDEVNLNSIEDVCVDDSVSTSTSGVSRSTEPLISHLIQFRKHQNWLHPSIRHKRGSRKPQWQCTILLFRRLLYQLEVQKPQCQSLIVKERSRDNYY